MGRRAADRERGEIKVCGLNAVLAVAKRRPEDIVRLYLVEDRLDTLKQVLRRLSEDRKAYRIVDAEELAKISESVHHEGVCIVAKQKHDRTFAEVLTELESAEGPSCMLLLDGVKNPHNLGANLRVAAHF